MKALVAPAAIGDEIQQFLPPREVEVNNDLAEELQLVFGDGGELEARRLN